MTKSEKEKARFYMMWVALWAIIIVAFGTLLLVYFGKDVASAGVIISSFFVALAGHNGVSFITKPSIGADDKPCNDEEE